MAHPPPSSPRPNNPLGLLHRLIVLGTGLILLVALTGCAPGNPDYITDRAGFWAGLWHGMILVFTFIIGLFNEEVHVYEVMNKGALYDFGFVAGAAIFFGCSGCNGKIRRSTKRAKQKEWEEFSGKFEDKVRKGIQSWLEESPQEDKEWAEIAGKIEEKIKRELRKWAEKE